AMYATERGVTFPSMWKISQAGLRRTLLVVLGLFSSGAFSKSFVFADEGPVKTALYPFDVADNTSQRVSWAERKPYLYKISALQEPHIDIVRVAIEAKVENAAEEALAEGDGAQTVPGRSWIRMLMPMSQQITN
ncbi:hypothetical protein B0H10DRAFT_2078909, partial [Mycena sp. CBHHK59/15]